MLRGRAGSPEVLRSKYQQIWLRNWPHDDSSLRELCREAKSIEEVLTLMRECHEFEGTGNAN